MELKEFVENVANQFEDTDKKLIQTDTVYKSLEEWSSLMALMLIAMVDDIYDVTIKGDDIRNANTIEDLFSVVKSRK